MTDQPIKKVMSKPEVARRMVQWAIELSQFNIEYHPRTTIKAQALADFITKFTLLDDKRSQDDWKKWMIQVDGSLVQNTGGVGIIINTLDGEALKYEVQLQFPSTNNEAEYEAILAGLRIWKALGPKSILLKIDSKLIIGKINGEYEAKEGRM